MSEHSTTPPDDADDAMGVEPEEESGAGYGNHAPDMGQEPEEADKDAR